MSDAYTQHRLRGPFPECIDPWGEAGRYFQQIHAGMIGHLLEQVQPRVESLGYLAGRETSLQIAERREPDIYVRTDAPPTTTPSWDYALSAEEIMAVPGIALSPDPPELQALTVRLDATLVTVVEIVSPRNKADSRSIADYAERRNRLIRRGVNVVEIDLTRSVMHLIADALAMQYAYHVAVHLPEQPPRFIGIDQTAALPRVALPLRGEVVPMELHTAYRHAYEVARIAAHILSENGYAESALPFPSLLDEAGKAVARDAVTDWRETLDHLRRR